MTVLGLWVWGGCSGFLGWLLWVSWLLHVLLLYFVSFFWIWVSDLGLLGLGMVVLGLWVWGGWWWGESGLAGVLFLFDGGLAGFGGVARVGDIPVFAGVCGFGFGGGWVVFLGLEVVVLVGFGWVLGYLVLHHLHSGYKRSGRYKVRRLGFRSRE
jgi:hypothetical protein